MTHEPWRVMEITLVPRASALGVGHAPADSAEVRRVALGDDERLPEHFRQNYRAAGGEGTR